MEAPHLEIRLEAIAHNARTLLQRCSARGMNLMGVTKAVCGYVPIAETLVSCGLNMLADSRLANIIRMRQSGIQAEFVLLRTALSQVEQVVQHAHISLNSELPVIRKLSEAAKSLRVKHKVILMVELGDLREGLMPEDLFPAVEQILKLPNIQLYGIGTNLACFGGIRPDDDKMRQLSLLAADVELRCNCKLPLVSGGNSANYEWLAGGGKPGRINNLRLGEALLLGCEPLQRRHIPGLRSDAFTFVGEVIEVKTKPSRPYGEVCQDSFGNIKQFADTGAMQRALLAGGLQDVTAGGLTPLSQVSVLGASSDHIIIDASRISLSTGQTLSFRPNYAALLASMTSPYVSKILV